MPYCFEVASKSIAENFTTSGSVNTEIDAAFLKPGSSRVLGLIALALQGKGAGLTALSGIVTRLKAWTSTASSGGTSITPATTDDRGPAAVHTAGAGTSGGTAAVTSGTGGPKVAKSTGCGATGPGGWVAPNPNAVIRIDGGADKSLDLFSASGTAGLNYEFSMNTEE